jgi:hypothetical protein
MPAMSRPVSERAPTTHTRADDADDDATRIIERPREFDARVARRARISARESTRTRARVDIARFAPRVDVAASRARRGASTSVDRGTTRRPSARARERARRSSARARGESVERFCARRIAATRTRARRARGRAGARDARGRWCRGRFDDFATIWRRSGA